MKQLKIGDTCFVGDVSVNSMKLYKLKSAKHDFLICPCHIPKSQPLVVASLLSSDIVMVHYYGDTTRVSIFYLSDLRKAE